MENVIEKEGTKIPIGNHLKKAIVLGNDHRGFKYKHEIIDFLKQKGYEIIDCGCDNDERCDYPLISQKIAEKIPKIKSSKVLRLFLIAINHQLSLPLKI